MSYLYNINKLLKPLTERNTILTNETIEEKQERIKKQFNLYHGKGKRKRKKK
jgi:hypothetical protein